MIIGKGDIASVLPDRKGFTFFASGVSNSQETRESEFTSEKNLLLQQPESTHLVYFSSLSIFYGKSRYVEHKKEMEDLVKQIFRHYTIIRIGNIDWGNNPHTIINYIRRKIKDNEPFRVEDVYRYIVNQFEFLHWISLIPEWNCEMNIPGERMKVRQIVETYGYT